MTKWCTRRVVVLGVTMIVAVGTLSGCDGGSDATGQLEPRGTRTTGTPGPVDTGFEGMAYPVPTGSVRDHVNSVPVTVENSKGVVVGRDFLPAGRPVRIRAVRGHADQVAIPSSHGRTMIAPRSAFWSMPSFIELKNVKVTIDGADMYLPASGIRYHRGSVATFRRFWSTVTDGLIATNRDFLACRRDSWGMGGQTFAVDVVEDGVHLHDRSVLEIGLEAITGVYRFPSTAWESTNSIETATAPPSPTSVTPTTRPSGSRRWDGPSTYLPRLRGRASTDRRSRSTASASPRSPRS